ncbi:MAG: TraX family protein [Nitrospirota bacterium]
MSQSRTWPRVELSDGAVEAMKWLGLILMTADHAQKYGLMPAVPGVYEAGRLAFPLFGIVLAYNLARVQNHDRARYVRVLIRLLVCGALASIPFIALGGLGFGWWPLNIMGTLAVAVGTMYVIEARGRFWKTRAAALFLLGGALVEFWWPGVALCVGAWLYIKHPTGGALLLWLAGTAGLTVINGNGWACASFAVLAGMTYLVTIEIPRASRWFYLYYPAHLGVFLLLGFSMPSPS